MPTGAERPSSGSQDGRNAHQARADVRPRDRAHHADLDGVRVQPRGCGEVGTKLVGIDATGMQDRSPLDWPHGGQLQQSRSSLGRGALAISSSDGAISATASLLWRHIATNRDLLEPDVTDEEVDRISKAVTPSAGFYVPVILLALVAPQVAAVGFLLIAVTTVFRQRGDRSSDAAASR